MIEAAEQRAQCSAQQQNEKACDSMNACGAVAGGYGSMAPSGPATPLVQVVVEVRANRSFGDVLNAAIYGSQRITRAGWNGPNQWVCPQHPDKQSKMGAPYLYLKNAQGAKVPWTPSQGDLFANDWAVLPS